MRMIAKQLGVFLLLCGLIVGQGFAQTATTVSAPDVAAVPGQTATVPINVTGFNDVGAITLIITYDANVLTFESLDNTPRSFTVNVPEPGEVRISWFDASTSDPITFGEGSLGDLRFAFDGEFSPIAFDAGQSEIADSEANVIDVTYTDGSVTAAEVGDPTATTEPATAISAQGATLNGTVNAGGGEATVTFEYRAVGADQIETVTADQSPVSGSEDVAVSAGVTGLQPETEYVFRVIAENSAGVAQGNDVTFTTGSAALVVDPEAVAFGNVPIGETEQATVTIENGGTAPFTIQTVALSGASDFSVAEDTEESTLDPGQTRTVTLAFAPQSQGTKSAELVVETGEDQRVVALSGTGQVAVPTATTETATDVTARSAILNGTVNPGGGDTEVVFEYRVAGSETVQTVTADQSPVLGTESVSVRAEVSALTPGTEYVFRVVAQNSSGSASGADQSFTTPIAAPTATTQAATDVRVERATLNGEVNAGGSSETTVTFEYRVAGTDDVLSAPADQSPISGTDAVAVSATVDALMPQTDYVFRVVAANSAGTTNGEELTFVTQNPALAVEPGALDFGELFLGRDSSQTVTLVNTSDLPFQFESIEIVDDPSGVFAITAPDPVPDQLAAGASVDLVIQFTPAERTETTATLQVQSTGGDRSVGLTGAGTLPEVSAETVTETPTQGEALSIAATTGVGFTPTQAQLFYRRGGAASYQQTDLTEEDGRFEGVLPAAAVTERGVDYYVQFSDGPTTATFPVETPQSNPVHVNVRVPALPADGALQPTTYRMISAPLNLDNPGAVGQLSDDLGAPGQDSWRLLRWNASSERYEEVPNLNATFTPGRAYWLIAEEGGTVDVDGGTSVGGAPVSLQLRAGWNQIAVPFAFPVNWNAVENSSAVDAPVAFDPSSGGDDPYRYGVQVIEPWTGYWVFNPSASTVTLSVPPVEAEAGTVAASKQTVDFPFGVAPEYALQLNATLSVAGSDVQLRDTNNFVGLAEQATAASGPEDVAEAPPIGEHVRLSVMENGQRWAGSLRPSAASGQTWELAIGASVDEPFFRRKQVTVTLTEHGTRPSGYELRAIDTDRDAPLAIENGRFTVQLTPDQPERHVRLVLGTASFTETKIADVPTTTGLGAAYPNPFTSSMAVEYRLDEAKQVTVAVYDMLGRRVRTLTDGRVQPGLHTVTWNGENADGIPASSGVYVVRMQAGSFVGTRRIVLVR